MGNEYDCCWLITDKDRDRERVRKREERGICQNVDRRMECRMRLGQTAQRAVTKLCCASTSGYFLHANFAGMQFFQGFFVNFISFSK